MLYTLNVRCGTCQTQPIHMVGRGEEEQQKCTYFFMSILYLQVDCRDFGKTIQAVYPTLRK